MTRSSRTAHQFLGDAQLPRLLALEGKLANLPGAARTYGPATVLNQIAITAQNFLAEISGQRDGLRAAAEAQARQQGQPEQAVRASGQAAVAQFDHRYGGLLAAGMPAGLPTLHNPGFAKAVVYNKAGGPRPQWQFIAPSDRSVAILIRPEKNLDQDATQQLVTAVRSTVEGSGVRADRVTI